MPSLPDDLIGQVVAGRYRVLDRLGAGGMGTVYLAVHEAIEKKVALKVLRAEYSAKPDLVTRFQREAISASRIKHPNVLDVFDFGQIENGCFYLAMEFLEGQDLADELERSHWLGPDRALKIAVQICKALAAAHAKGVVHRDLKPENVFLQVTAEGEEVVKIVDFGIAQLRSTEEVAKSEPQRRRLTRTGMIFGTPEYMSPEQGAGKHADLRVDVYAAGVILYEMLSGAVPFTGDTFFGVLNAHMNDPLIPLSASNPEVHVSAELEAVIAKALEKNPDHRFQSMRELANALASTPEGAALDPAARKSAIPSVTLAEFDRAAEESARAAPVPSVRAQARPPTAPVSGAVTLDSVPNDIGSADTQPVAPGAQRRKSSNLWLFAVLGLVLVAGVALAALRLVPRDAGPQVAASENPAPLGTSVVPVASSAPLPGPSATAAPVSGIRISVTTDPEGAVLLKSGFQICDTTPCDFYAKINEGLELEARKDKLQGTAKVLAQKEQSVHIKLAPKSAGVAAPHPTVEMVPCLIEVEQNGLKMTKKAMCPKPK
jgi:serine/threonine protein kinase